MLLKNVKILLATIFIFNFIKNATGNYKFKVLVNDGKFNVKVHELFNKNNIEIIENHYSSLELEKNNLNFDGIIIRSATKINKNILYTQNNLQFLKDKGAFQHKAPELYEYDQFADNQEKINEILKGRTIDIAIDDGHHSDSSITNTLDTLMPHLSKQFVYFIEDNRTVQPLLTEYKCKLFNYKKLTVLENE